MRSYKALYLQGRGCKVRRSVMRRCKAPSLLWRSSKVRTWKGASLHGAYLLGAQLQGANLNRTNLQGASLAHAALWRAQGTPVLDLTDLQCYDLHTKPWDKKPGQGGSVETFIKWLDRNKGLPPTYVRVKEDESVPRCVAAVYTQNHLGRIGQHKIFVFVLVKKEPFILRGPERETRAALSSFGPLRVHARRREFGHPFS
jgi:Pentapeptide repeats (8 copies)